MFRFKVPGILPRIFPQLTWSLPTTSRVLYLTFDDGPHPEITAFALETLHRYGAKATFFCVGDNVDRYPETYARLLREGHRAGNHTQHHRSGWTCNTETYLDEVQQCAQRVDSKLFRPPYGRITLNQARALKPNYQVIMWDILTRDFDRNLNPAKSLEAIRQHSQPGSILVLHDSLKAEANMRVLLPAILDHFSNLDYQFKVLP